MMRKQFMVVVSVVFLMGMTMTGCGNDGELVKQSTSEGTDHPTGEKDQQTGEIEDEPEGDDFPDSMVVDMLPTTRAIELTPAQKELAKKSNDFCFNFFRELNDTQKKSFIASPLSLSFILGMLNDGAAGQTAEEIMTTLGFGDADKQAVNEYCKALITQAPIADPSVALRIANIVATNKGVELENAFKENMTNYYEAETASLDFSQPSALTYLNDWCKAKTEGMIPEIIENLSPQAKLVLMNAIFFKATWTEKFDENDTNTEPFTKADGSSVELPMMHRNALIWYAANDLYSAIRLPYGSGDRYSMYVLLPEPGKTVDDVIASLTYDNWQKNYFEPVEADIKLPRFTTKSDMDLNDIMARLGAPSMFDPDKADFTGISKNEKQLYVSLLKQKAAIEVTEEGTKTSAATVAMMCGSAFFDKNANFHANRPFVYLIKEEDAQAFFFIGTYQGD